MQRMENLLLRRGCWLFAICACQQLLWAEPAALPDWLQLGGDLRIRLEAFDGEDLNDRAHDGLGRNNVIGENDEWILTRLRLHANAHLADRLRMYVELTDARLFEDQYHRSERPGTRRNWEQDRLDLFQGYFDVKLDPGLHLVLGRQVLKYGSQRYMGEYDWWNTPFSFDAVTVQVRRSAWDVDLVVGQNAVNDDRNFNDSDDSFTGRFGTLDDNTMYGLYGVRHNEQGIDLDMYTFYQDNDNEDTHVCTVGGRLYGPVRDVWDFETELMVQPGSEVEGRDHFAWTASGEVGRTFPGNRWSPRVFLGYDYATGDRDPRDRDSDGFKVYYADDYSHLGHQEFFQRTNLHAAHAGVESRFWNSVQCTLELFSYWTAEDDDSWVGRYQTFVISGSRHASNHIGTATDVTVSFPIQVCGRDVNTLLRYSRFFAGEFVEDVKGVADDADEAALMFQYFF